MTVIHIGYPRAGSTFLQNNIFPYIKEYHYLNYNLLERREKENFKRVFQEIIYRNRIMIDDSKIRKEIDKITKNTI